MRFTFLLLLFFISADYLPAQVKEKQTIKIKKDSIDYQSFSFDDKFTEFDLKKIRQFKGQEIYNVSGKLYFLKWIDQSIDSIPTPFWPFLYKVSTGDTITQCNWDRDTREVSKAPWHHDQGLIRLDQKNNILYLTKDLENPKTKTKYVGTKKFKILMWTKDQIILKDITKGNEEFNRKFFFVRRPLPYK